MKARNEFLIKCMVPVLGFALCGTPELLQAQEASPAPQQSQPSGTTIDPSKGPLQPIPTQTEPEGPRTVYPGSGHRPHPESAACNTAAANLGRAATGTTGRSHG